MYRSESKNVAKTYFRFYYLAFVVFAAILRSESFCLQCRSTIPSPNNNQRPLLSQNEAGLIFSTHIDRRNKYGVISDRLPLSSSTNSESSDTASTKMIISDTDPDIQNSTIQQMITNVEILTNDTSLHLLDNTPQTWNKVIRSLATTTKGSVKQSPLSRTSTSDLAFQILQYVKEQKWATIFSYNYVLDIFAKNGDAMRAQELLHCMESGLEVVPPDTVSYNAVINAWSKSSAKDAAIRAEELLNLLLTGGTITAEPDTISFNSVVDAWAKSNTEESADRAEFWLNTMEEFHESSGKENYKPDIFTWTCVIDAFARCKRPDSPFRAEGILKRMHKLYKADRERNIKPNVRCFNAVLNAWASESHAVRGAAERAQELLESMEQMSKLKDYTDIQPDIYAYNCVLKAWGNSRIVGSATKAHQLLTKMEHLSQTTGKKTYDEVSFNTVIDAYSKSRQPGSIQAAEGLFVRMKELGLKPDAFSLTALMDVYAKSNERDAARRAETFLSTQESDGVQSTTACYNAVMNAWVRSGEFDAAVRVEHIMGRMYNLYQTGRNVRVKPNARSYTILVDAWAKSKSIDVVHRVEEILEEVEEMYNSGDTHVKPTVHFYTAVINAWARSNEPNKAEMAAAVLEKCKEQHKNGNDDARPNVFAYNAVLNACAYTTGDEQTREDAFKIGCAVFNELRKSLYGPPNHVTYGTFLRVCAKLMPTNSDGRRSIVEAVFRRCCKDGQVGEYVLSQLWDAAPYDLYKELLRGVVRDVRDVRLQDLPVKWTCNVRERRFK